MSSLFISNHININAAEQSNYDWLHSAILKNSIKEVRQALQQGVNINQGKSGKSPLLWAVILKRSTIVRELINHGANINITYLSHPLVHHALKNGDVKSALYLVKKGASFLGYVDEIQRNVMDYAFVHFKSPPRDEDDKFLSKAILLEFIQELVNHGYPINNSHYSSNIWFAAIKRLGGGSGEVLKIFLKNQADPNQIIDTNSSVRGTFWTPLLRAVEYYDKEAIKILLDAGADINKQAKPMYNGPFHTPLSYALARVGNNSDMVEFLIQQGATL